MQPLCMMAIYTLVFGLIFKGATKGSKISTDYALGIFLSLTIFQMLADVVNTAPSTVLGQPNLVKKVVFPLEILPLSRWALHSYQFAICLILTLIGVVAIGQGLSLQSLWFFVALLPLLPLAFGVALLFFVAGAFSSVITANGRAFQLALMYASVGILHTKHDPRDTLGFT